MLSQVGKSWAWTMLQAFLTATLICLVYWAWLILRSPDNFPVRHMKIVAPGLKVSSQKIQAIVLENFQGGFFSFSGSRIKKALMNEPWLASATIRRLWPDTIEIAVAEKTAVLEWNSTQLVDTQAHLFQPPESSFPENLPQLFGPVSNFKEVYEKYQLYNSELNSLGLAIQSLKESDRLSWTLKLNNQIPIILGEKNPDARFERFAHNYQNLIGKKSPCVDYVDLRYPDGITIRWKNLDKNQNCPLTT